MRAWIVDVVVGGVLGTVAGAIAAVNLITLAGIERGYEATPAEVYDENWVVGVIATALVVAGLVGGIVLARYLRRQRFWVRRQP